jgi:hypothetical protein
MPMLAVYTNARSSNRVNDPFPMTRSRNARSRSRTGGRVSGRGATTWSAMTILLDWK